MTFNGFYLLSDPDILDEICACLHYFIYISHSELNKPTGPLISYFMK